MRIFKHGLWLPGSTVTALQWRHNERPGVSNHRQLHCLFKFSPGAHQRKQQSSESLEIHQRPVDSLHKRPLTRKMFSLDDVNMMRSEARLTWLGPGVPPARDDTFIPSWKLCGGVVHLDSPHITIIDHSHLIFSICYIHYIEKNVGMSSLHHWRVEDVIKPARSYLLSTYLLFMIR